MLDPLDEVTLKDYFRLSERLLDLEKYREKVHREFYMQTMSSHVEFVRVVGDQYETVTRGFRPDREIVKLYECMDVIERRINRSIFRKKHFEDFLAELPMEDLERLESRFRKEEEVEVSLTILSSVLDEIDEIEAALCYRAGIEPDPKNTGIDLLEDTDQNLERMCDFFAI